MSVQNRESLPDFTVKNIREAGRCLVFDRFTAVGFHAMRAVEDIARRYFSLVTGRPTEGKKPNGDQFFMTLGQMAAELDDKARNMRRQRQSSGQLGIIAPLLQQLCTIYRNPLDHPEIIALEEDRAIDVFNQATNVIGAMLDDVRLGGEHFEWRSLP